MLNVVFMEGAKLEERLRTWTVPMISYWLPFVAPFLIGLGLGDSPLVILSLCSFAPFFVISFFSFCFLSFVSVLPSALWLSHEVVFYYTSLLLIKKTRGIICLEKLIGSSST